MVEIYNITDFIVTVNSRLLVKVHMIVSFINELEFQLNIWTFTELIYIDLH